MELNVEMYRAKVVLRVLCVVPGRVRTVHPGGGLVADLARTCRGFGGDLART